MVAVPVMAATRQSAAVVPAAAVTGANWMSALADERRIGDFTIPGTHDTMALYDFPGIEDTARAQSLTLREQLLAGVRFLDIRCRHVGDAFAIHHGRVYQHANFDDVLETVRVFLEENPSETILMSVKPEHEPADPVGSFTDVFRRYVRTYDERQAARGGLFFGLDGGNAGAGGSQSMPRLGALGAADSCRGKIILINRFNAAAGGVPTKGWPGNGTGEIDTPLGFRVRVQDVYELPNLRSGSLAAKLNAFERTRVAATQAAPGTLLTLNFASSHAKFLGIPEGIRRIADYMNARIPGLLEAGGQAGTRSAGRSGVIVLDYATPELVGTIWRTSLPAAAPELPPTAPPRVVLFRNTGRIDDDLTSDPTIRVLATIPVGSRLELSVNGGAWTTAVVGGDGTTLPAGIGGDGRYEVRARVVDATNQPSPESDPVRFQLDRFAAPLLVSLASKTGSRAKDGVTWRAKLAVFGQEPGARVEYARGDAEGQTGSWGDYRPELGSNVWRVRQIDTVGNVSTPVTIRFVLLSRFSMRLDGR